MKALSRGYGGAQSPPIDLAVLAGAERLTGVEAA